MAKTSPAVLARNTLWRRANAPAVKAAKEAYYTRHPDRKRLNRVARGARERGVEFSLLATSVEWTGRCALTGLDFNLEGDGLKARWNSPSLDRIDHTKGYVEGNCRWVLFCINAFRGTMSDEQMYAVAAALLEVK